MANHSIPGVRIGRGRSLASGVITVLLTAATALAWHAAGERDAGTHLRIQLRTEQIGAGIATGTTVRFDDVAIGRIAEVRPIEQGRQLLTLDLDPAQTAGLTDALRVDYAPENLFSVSAVALRTAPGGTPLRDGQVIDLAGRVNDVTMGALLRSLTQTATDVLTPKLTELLTQADTDLRAFTPVLQAVVSISRVVADTQQYPSSYLLARYAGFFAGFGSFTSATFKLAKAILDIPVFQQDRDRYNRSIEMLRTGVLEGLATTVDTVHQSFGDFTDPLAPTLQALANTVPDPQLSHSQLTETLDRLDRMFTDTPDGPALNVTITLLGGTR
ncbi:mammalian cell entry protein [Nocardia sp. ET3-3]|uniref:Mammalian cell entry protein n=1 Tax=Nocardia terrae TaxID=2675851 RepID=A0A7K1UTM5_9NOCA|nr:mammalian cell entry protein [Nocardia terrae]MVU77208.1 mammalian cell entry protein [Nocardia terrae]